MDKHFVYNPKGTCSKEMDFIIDEQNKIKDISILGGCNGNLKGIRSLIIGMDVNQVIDKLEGINCGNKGTSCPDQIAKGLKEYLQTK